MKACVHYLENVVLVGQNDSFADRIDKKVGVSHGFADLLEAQMKYLHEKEHGLRVILGQGDLRYCSGVVDSLTLQIVRAQHCTED